ncbi:6,7-dimethyl-8-ribityllumazine synthase 2 [Aquimixticola soesokkakensis]|uniref:6,7-dimethyl-8-ribityllumazine synthase n=1 Tax=Aquimixticola soesokkakensis TaxID=1519096 RepID=A0A1Y5TKS8_9RHOB|nr:6,7-dimethyl-8-ribityllumazine synthase [Aquimixticola soesokkakensis]SLN62689.1 6,7-dimethyl-8-ribityllumazine synthase 2 [Aquimixticola soesokkakensis]
MTQSLSFAFISASWHADIVDQARKGFEARIRETLPDAVIDTFAVPGAFEMPLVAKKLAQTGKYSAIAAGALVVDGGIYRHEFVAQSVVQGLMDVGLETGIPVLSVSLTPHHFQPTEDHQAFFFDHFEGKGREAANAALQLAALEGRLTATPLRDTSAA